MRSPDYKQNPPKELPLEKLAMQATQRIGSTISLILHSIFFIGIFGLQWFGFAFDQIMLILTTAVSLEAIYLSIFIQMSVNRQARKIEEVSEDVDDIQEDVEGISKDIDDIQEDVGTIQEDAKEISEDVDDIQEYIEDIRENVEDLSEGYSKNNHEDQEGGAGEEKLQRIEKTLEELLREVKKIRKS